MEKLRNFYLSQDQVVFWSTFSCLVLGLVIALSFLITQDHLPNKLPLFYSLTWGEHQLVSKPQFLLLPFLVFFISFINLFISWHLHSSQLVLKRILCLSSLVISLLILITTFKIFYIFI